MFHAARCIPQWKLVIHSRTAHAMDNWEEVADDAVCFYGNVIKTGEHYTPVPNE